MIKIVNPEQHTREIGNYSASTSVAVGSGKFVFISGQVPSDRAGCTMGTTMREQTEYVFQNLIKVLAANGGNLHDLASITIFLKDLQLFHEFNEVRNKYFLDHKPASTLVEVSSLAIDEHMVEINGIAFIR